MFYSVALNIRTGVVVVANLHPVRRRVDFKISTLVYRSLAGTAPVYLADECTLVTSSAVC